MAILKKFKIDGEQVGFLQYIKYLLNRFTLESKVIREKLKNIPKTNFELGLRHLQRGNLSDAIMRFKMVTFLVPDHKEAFYYLGCALIRDESYEQAQEAFEKTLEIDPGFTEAGYMLKKIQNPSDIKKIPDSIIKQNLKTALPSEDYQSTPIYQRARFITSKLLKYVQDKNPNFSILDVECGNTVTPLVLLLEKEMAKTIDGITVSQPIAESLSEFTIKEQKIYRQCSTTNYEEYLSAKGEPYDIILIEHAWKWLGELDNISKLIAGKTKKGGYCITIIPIADINKAEGYRLNRKYDSFEYSESYVKFQMEAAGFTTLYTGGEDQFKNDKKLFIFQKK